MSFPNYLGVLVDFMILLRAYELTLLPSSQKKNPFPIRFQNKNFVTGWTKS